jgi:hypothetical protein
MRQISKTWGKIGQAETFPQPIVNYFKMLVEFSGADLIPSSEKESL